MSIISIQNLVKIYGDKGTQVKALNGINLSIKEGEMVAIMGTSGSGKSTLLNVIGCIDKATSGNYFLNGKDIESINSREMAIIRNEIFGFIVQDFALIEKYTVEQNIKIPLVYSRKSINSKKIKIEDVLKKLDIYSKKNVLPCKLSGGQRQRVAIARAIINDPKIILADEPTGSLDSKTGLNVMKILKNINEENKTIIIVTHDSNIANLCNRTIKIEDGKIIHN